MEIDKFTIIVTAGVQDAMYKLEEFGNGILFCVDDNNLLLGVLTDGDIRRYLLDGGSLQDRITHAMNSRFVSLSSEVSNREILSSLSTVRFVPLVSDEGVLLDYASKDRLKRVPVASPLLDGNERAYVEDCLDTNWISSQGAYVMRFEEEFKNYHEGFEAVSVSNGTVALHLAFLALGIGPGDEVILPNLTFAATINAVIYTGATPVLVDVELDSFNIDPSLLKEALTKKTKAIVPVHLYGQACNMGAIMEVAAQHDLYIIEDAAEAIGTKYCERPVGVFGDAATFSFFGNKTITTGEGGMVVFKSPERAKLARQIRDHGMSPNKRYWHEMIGYNYRLTNLQAAIGVAQLERLPDFIQHKRKIAGMYNELFSQVDFIDIPVNLEFSYHSYWLYTVIVRENSPFKREDLMKYLSIRGVETRPVFYPLNIMPPYEKYANGKCFPNSLFLSKNGLSLPSSAAHDFDEIEFVVDRIKEFVRTFGVNIK